MHACMQVRGYVILYRTLPHATLAVFSPLPPFSLSFSLQIRSFDSNRPDSTVDLDVFRFLVVTLLRTLHSFICHFSLCSAEDLISRTLVHQSQSNAISLILHCLY